MVLRVGGLASGMDIDSIVKNLMTAERMPLDKLKQKKQTLEWQRDDYRAMNTLLLDFRSELTNMRLTTQYRARTVTSSDDSKVTATASSAASQASYSITQVDRMATAARQTVASIGTVDAAKTLEDQFANFTQKTVQTETFTTAPSTWQLGKSNLIDTDFKLAVDGTSYSLDGNDGNGNYFLKDLSNNQIGTVNLESGEVKFDVPNSLDGKTVTAEYKQKPFIWKVGGVGEQSLVGTGTNTLNLTLATGIEINTDELDAMSVKVNGTSYTLVNKAPDDLLENEVAISSSGVLSFKNNLAATDKVSVNYITNESLKKYADFAIESYTSATPLQSVKEKFLIQSTDTLNQVIEEINKSTAGVTMFYDSFTGGLSLTRSETGNFNSSGKEMNVTGDFATRMLQLGGVETGGENAKFTINGLSTERSSNTFDMNGVNITLKKEFASTEGAASLSINNDGNAVFENIKSFVDKYNELIGKISAKTSEERYRTYTPLTDAQRETLSEKQQEQWEEKAKSGLLRRDTVLSGVLSSMRSNFSQPVSNSDTDPLFSQLASIGITTTKNYLEGGKLEINESELKAAINNNPDAVEALFRGGNDATAISEKGIIHRLYDSVNASMDKLKDRAGSTLLSNQQFALGRQLATIDKSITRFEDRLTQVEERYWKQFTAMEKAIQQANSQSSYLSQQFSSFYS